MYVNELYHYGVKGMKWGVRRYQKKDGSLTRAGIKRLNEATEAYPMRNGKTLKYGSKKSYHRNMTADMILTDKAINEGSAKTKSEKDKIYRKYSKLFVDKYADATLKDLGMNITPEVKKYTEDLLKRKRVYGTLAIDYDDSGKYM